VGGDRAVQLTRLLLLSYGRCAGGSRRGNYGGWCEASELKPMPLGCSFVERPSTIAAWRVTVVTENGEPETSRRGS